MTDAELRTFIERRRGRKLTLAESNIDIAGLNRDLNDGKAKLTAAIEKAKTQAVNEWISRGMYGQIHVTVTPEISKLLAGLHDIGYRHGQEELRKAGYASYAATPSRRNRLAKLTQQIRTLLGGINFRINQEAAAQLSIEDITAAGLAAALAKLPGALDVAGRLTSPAVYSGLGAAFDQASDTVDADPLGGGGNGWEYTAVMDGGTCDVCAEQDGTTYPTWDEAQTDLPDGGPNPDCLGGTRCRCRLAPVPL